MREIVGALSRDRSSSPADRARSHDAMGRAQSDQSVSSQVAVRSRQSAYTACMDGNPDVTHRVPLRKTRHFQGGAALHDRPADRIHSSSSPRRKMSHRTSDPWLRKPAASRAQEGAESYATCYACVEIRVVGIRATFSD